MLKVFVKGRTFEVSVPDQGPLLVDGKALNWDLKRMENGMYSVLIANRSHTVQLCSFEREEKCLTLKLDHETYRVSYRDDADLLLEKMGLEAVRSKAVSELKAPMPGRIASIGVVKGQSVKRGDLLLVLEAMKMENAIKAPSDAVIKTIAVSTAQTVEKNQPLIQFE